jgi:hypothetical protein
VDLSALGNVYNLYIDGCIKVFYRLTPLISCRHLSALYLENLKFGLVPNHMVKRISISAHSLAIVINNATKRPRYVQIKQFADRTVSPALMAVPLFILTIANTKLCKRLSVFINVASHQM